MRSLRFTLLALLLAACDDDGKPPADSGDSAVELVDDDGDGHSPPEDCDDSDAEVHPEAQEICDGVDNNCDGQVDEGLLVTLYADSDGDGYGDPGASEEACPGSADLVEDNSDCDDADALVNPAAVEACDGVDNDCNDLTDDEVEYFVWYADQDGDGYGDPGIAQKACAQPKGYVDPANGEDCDDSADQAFPGNTEVCDGLDNDCNGETDGEDAEDASTWYLDSDGDGYGDDDSQNRGCEPPNGYLKDNSDCDDSDAGVNPGATEICDADDTDEDCNGLSDDADGGVDLSTMSQWYPDADGDGHGDQDYKASEACNQPSGYAADAIDCDDGDASVYTGADEYCDDQDNDCDGWVDEGSPVDAPTWYRDSDGDGFGDAGATTTSCDPVSGYVGNDADCDDNDALVGAGCGDTGGDTGDTGSSSRDGDYEGTVTIDVTLVKLGLNDTCEGEVALTVAEAGKPQIQGSGECEFQGILAVFGAQSGNIDGNISSDPDCDGNIVVGSMVSGTWEGSFSDSSTIEGEFSGSVTLKGIPVDYDGSFEAVR